MKKMNKTERELQLLNLLEIAIKKERKMSNERIALLEGALENAHKVFSAEIEQLHKQIARKHSK